MTANYNLTKFEKEFAIRFMEMGNQEAAYKAVYHNKIAKQNLTDNAIKIGAAKMLKNPDVVAFIQEVRGELAGTALVDIQQLVIDLAQMATADINEICQIRRECCRHCWSIDNNYEWAEWEATRAVQKHKQELHKWEKEGADISKEPQSPDFSGGYGWHPHRDPNPDCPRCYGDGVLNTWVADSRTLSKGARKLYSGFEHDKFGNLKVLTKSQEEAQAKLMRIFGAWNPVRNATPGAIRDAADKVDDANAITINLINSPDA